MPDEVDVTAQAVHAVHVRQLEEHDVLDTADRLQPNQPTNDEDDGDIQANDAATNHSALIYDNLCTTATAESTGRNHTSVMAEKIQSAKRHHLTRSDKLTLHPAVHDGSMQSISIKYYPNGILAKLIILHFALEIRV